MRNGPSCTSRDVLVAEQRARPRPSCPARSRPRCASSAAKSPFLGLDDSAISMPRSRASTSALTRFTPLAEPVFEQPRGERGGEQPRLLARRVRPCRSAWPCGSRPCAICACSSPSRRARSTNGRTSASSVGSTAAMLTALATCPLSRKSAMSCAASTATFSCASTRRSPEVRREHDVRGLRRAGCRRRSARR